MKQQSITGKRRRHLLLASVASAMFVLSGCGNSDPVETPTDVEDPVEIETPVEPIIEVSLIDAAVNDAARPADQIDTDIRRMPAELLAFAEIEPGDVVGDLIPGAGYWTRLFAKATGPTGTVYAFAPASDSGEAPLGDITADSANYANVAIVQLSATAPITSPELLDVLWTSQNYHDLKNLPPPTTTALINAMLFATLKPGGLYIVIDHSAAADAPDDVTDTLHRIREGLVREEVEAAGFVFVEASDVLQNPADPRDIAVFDEAIRGNTDQFVLKFRKPE